MMANRLTSTAQYWEFDLDSFVVSRLLMDFSVVLVLLAGKLNLEVQLENSFVLHDRKGAEEGVHIDLSAGAVGMAPVLDWFGADVRRIVVHKGGCLELHLKDGRWLSADHSYDTESWNIAGSDGLRFVCMPGGEVAVWLPDGLQ